jgi:hypothetical protein
MSTKEVVVLGSNDNIVLGVNRKLIYAHVMQVE